MLEGKGLSFRYGTELPWIVRGLDVAVAPGEAVGVRGYSGRGKTTLARLLAGYLDPLEGDVRVDGARLAALEGFCPVQLVFQHPEHAVNPRWRMRRVLAESGGVSEEACALLGIEDLWLDRYLNELSGGELQRFCVARALTERTRYLIADEMTTMLDALEQARIWRAVREWTHEHEVGLLVVSHDDALLGRLCDRVIDVA